MPPDGRGPDQWAGQAGDHRLARLVIPLPRETAKKIKSCVALFVLDDNRNMISPLICERACQKDTQQFTCVNEHEWNSCTVHAAGNQGDAYFKDGKVYFVLWRDLTQCRALRVQLECYSDDTGNRSELLHERIRSCSFTHELHAPLQFIDRTPISERIMFGKSLSTCLRDFPEVSSNPSVLAQMIAWMHPPMKDVASDVAFRFAFATGDWLQSGPEKYRITVPLETHGKGPLVYVSAANIINEDGDLENAFFSIRRTPRGDIIVTSDEPVDGEIFIEKGVN